MARGQWAAGKGYRGQAAKEVMMRAAEPWTS